MQRRFTRIALAEHMLMTRFIRYFLPVYLWLILIFVASSISSQDSLPPLTLFPHSDKVVHFITYLILGFILRRAFHFSDSEIIRQNGLHIAVICALLWGLSDEIHQAYVPGRSADFADFIADGIGALAAQPLFSRWQL